MAEPLSDITITGTEQRRAWLARAMPPVEQLAVDLWSIPVPMPNNPLRYVLVYAFADDSGLVLLDAGWDSEEAWQALQAGLSRFGGTPADIRGVLVSHQHFDHIGLARRIRAASGAWIALHPADRDAISRPEFRDPAVADAADLRHLRLLGASEEQARELLPTDPTRARSRYALPDRLIEDGDVVAACGRMLRAVHTPGHTPGHLCFVDEEAGVVFSGDTVLPRISPNIPSPGSTMPNCSRLANGDSPPSRTAGGSFASTMKRG